MSSESFSTSPTRQIEAGDTPGFNDDQKSRPMAAQNIPKGTASLNIAGNITIATAALVTSGIPHSPFVPVESKDNSGGSTGDLEIRGVVPGQMVALTATTGPIQPGTYVQIGATAGQVIAWVGDNNQKRYARYFGKEAGVFSRGSGGPFIEDLSTGVIPDQPLLSGEVGWFTLMEAIDA